MPRHVASRAAERRNLVPDDRNLATWQLDNVDLDIDGITADGERAIEGAASTEALNQVDTEFLGKRSALTRAHRALGGLDPEARKEAGRRLDEAQAQLEGAAGGAAGRAGARPSGPRPSWPTAST